MLGGSGDSVSGGVGWGGSMLGRGKGSWLCWVVAVIVFRVGSDGVVACWGGGRGAGCVRW